MLHSFLVCHLHNPKFLEYVCIPKGYYGSSPDCNHVRKGCYTLPAYFSFDLTPGETEERLMAEGVQHQHQQHQLEAVQVQHIPDVRCALK
jgi:hypothetical protein